MFSKAKAAKLVRELVDRFLDMEATTGKEASHIFNPVQEQLKQRGDSLL